MPFVTHRWCGSQEQLFDRLPLNKRRASTKKAAKTDEPSSPAAAVAAAYVGAGKDVTMDIIFRRDAQGVRCVPIGSH